MNYGGYPYPPQGYPPPQGYGFQQPMPFQQPPMAYSAPPGYPAYPGMSPPGMPQPFSPYGASPPMMSPGMPMGTPPPQQQQQQQQQQQSPPARHHAGIGAVGQAPNIQPANAPAPSPYGQAAASGERFTLFVSTIADGLEDFWLERLFNACGPLVQLKRPKDPSGKPKAFAFVDYGDADSIRRCMEVINGLSLRGKDGSVKQLAIKADAKTQDRINEHEAGRMKTDNDNELVQYAQNQVKDVMEQMGDPELQKLAEASMKGEPLIARRAPNHLQDLGPDDLPKESRGLITSEIAFFRQRVFDKEGPKDGRSELEKVRGVSNTVIAQLGDSAKGPRQPPTGPATTKPPSQPSGPASRAPPTAPAGPAADRAGNSDPQSFNKPVNFVKGDQNGDPKITDEERERRRQEAKRREQEQTYRERERRWEQRERQRQSAMDREKQRERQQDQDEDRQGSYMRRYLADFDDEREAERGREIYFSDRARWRANREAFRRREQDEDERDAKLEAQQIETLKRESEAFLNQQAELFAKMTSKTGASLDDTTHIKLSLAAAKKETVDSPAPLPKPRAVAFGAAEDEDEARKKRALIPLTYEDVPENEEELGMTDEQKLDRRKAKVRELVESIPMDKEGLWRYELDWATVSEDAITEKLAPFVQKKCVEVLGMEDDDLVSTVLDHVRSHKSAADLAAELGEILDMEAADEVVVKIWRFVIFESLAAQHNIQTST